MYADKRLLGLILARGGSKGIPGKNIAEVGGKPLVAWSIEAGLGSAFLDRLVVSTDDPEIARLAVEWGADVPFMRPAHLATDECSSAEAALHAVDALDGGYHYVVLLQPTSPLRGSDDVDGAIRHCLDSDARSCATVTDAPESPWRMYTLDKLGIMHPAIPVERIERRQDLPAAVVPNGAVFISEVGELRRTGTFFDDGTLAHWMPPERSLEIDTPLDLFLVRALIDREAAEG